MGEDDEPLAIEMLADARLGGYGFAIMRPGGKIERIDPDKIFADEKMPEGYTARREALRKK